MCDKEKDRQIAHLERLREDIRDEIKKRIGQRDSYSMQLTIALSVIIGIAFSTNGCSEILIIAPFVSIYYIILIMYSYEVHRFAANYLRKEIEPRLAILCKTDSDMEWETYYKAEGKVPGIRRWFFSLMGVIVPIIFIVYLWSTDKFIKQGNNLNIRWTILIILTGIYAIAIVSMCVWQYREKILEILICSGLLIFIAWIFLIFWHAEIERIILGLTTCLYIGIFIFVPIWRKHRKKIFSKIGNFCQWLKELRLIKSIMG